MCRDTIITAAMIEAERLRRLAEAYEITAASHEREAVECERLGLHARAAYHRQSATHDRVQAVRWRDEARRVEANGEPGEPTESEARG